MAAVRNSYTAKKAAATATWRNGCNGCKKNGARWKGLRIENGCGEKQLRQKRLRLQLREKLAATAVKKRRQVKRAADIWLRWETATAKKAAATATWRNGCNGCKKNGARWKGLRIYGCGEKQLRQKRLRLQLREEMAATAVKKTAAVRNSYGKKSCGYSY